MSGQTHHKKIFVIIPAFNETNTIRLVVEDVLHYGYNVIVVDDGSSEDIRSSLPGLPIWFLQHPVNLGQGAALQTGIEFALGQNADIIVTFDADGQHQAKDISTLIETLEKEKVEIVLGSRFMEGSGQNMSAKRKKLLKIARYANFFFTGLLLTDAHNGLRAMTAPTAEQLAITQNGMSHATEILSRIRHKKINYKEVPVDILYSGYSKKKGQTIWSGFRIFFDILLNKIFK